MDYPELRNLNGTQWPAAVGKIWDTHRSRFGSSWEDLPHHDQVTIYRLLTGTTPPPEIGSTQSMIDLIRTKFEALQADFEALQKHQTPPEPAPAPAKRSALRRVKARPTPGTLIRTAEELEALPGHTMLRYTAAAWNDHETDGKGFVYSRQSNARRDTVTKRPVRDLLDGSQVPMEVQNRSGKTCLLNEYEIQQKKI